MWRGGRLWRITHARVVKLVDTRDLNNLSLRAETPEVKPVKVGEGPGRKCELMPSQAQFRQLGRCREQTAGTYGRKAMVKACSRPRTAHVRWRRKPKWEENPSPQGVPVRFRPRAPIRIALVHAPGALFCIGWSYWRSGVHVFGCYSGQAPTRYSVGGGQVMKSIATDQPQITSGQRSAKVSRPTLRLNRHFARCAAA